MDSETVIRVSKDEQKAIKSLEALGRKWPETLFLFSWSGSLHVMKHLEDGRLGDISHISGIPNDGGDPTYEEVDQYCKIEWE
jgi:hypothetical protein